MRFPIRHKTIFWVLLLVFTTSLVIVWFYYVQIMKFQGLQLREKALLCTKVLEKRQKVENIYIAKAFIRKISFIKAIASEDLYTIEKTINEILNLSFYSGGAIVKGERVIFRTKSVPDLDYTIFIPYKKIYPHKIYTYSTEKGLCGFSVFALPYGGKDVSVILSLDWKNFIEEMFSLSDGFIVSLAERPRKPSLNNYPLLDINKVPVGYIVFDFSESVSYLRRAIKSILLFMSIALFILFAPWILYIKIEKEAISKVVKAIEEPLEEPSLEHSLDLAIKTLYTHRVYRRALEVAINTKSVKETLRALATSLSEIVDSRYWLIALFSYDVQKWRFLLWSFGIDPKCLDEVLIFMKKNINKDIIKIARGKKVIFLTDLIHNEKIKSVPCLLRYDVRAAVIVPMIVKDKTIGILMLTWDYDREFDNHDHLIFEDVKNMIKDILENTYNIQDMFWLSYQDPLLGIYNRRILETLTEGEHKGVILYLDLDNFKKVNDVYGHEEGDKVLKEFVGIVKKIIRKEDVFLRYGGDEFIIYLRDIEIDDAKKIAERIKDMVKEAFSHYGVTVSVGMAELSSGVHLYDRIAEAEQKMYDEKREKHPIGDDWSGKASDQSNDVISDDQS